MKWEKKGLIYCPDGSSGWDQHSFMTPTAIHLDEKTIRIYGGCRDNKGVSRIRYIDVSANNPNEVIRVSENPVLDIGEDGCFDDNGVILGDVIRVNKDYYMYYVGFQKVEKVKFLAFTGLAISQDNGENFKRYSDAPICDRNSDSRYFRAIHSIMYEDGVFKAWLGAGREWKYINNMPYPSYGIWYTESKDGILFSRNDLKHCISPKGNEYRIGRPRVYKDEDKYQMYYTRDFMSKDYVIGYAESMDGKSWSRMDDEFQLEKSDIGWDSEMCCYPVIIKWNNKTYMFYSGNGMGKTGVGYAELVNGTL